MPETPRKPPVAIPMESTEPHSIRFTPTQWSAICAEARLRGEEPSRLVRRLAIHALQLVIRQREAEAYSGLTFGAAGGRL